MSLYVQAITKFKFINNIGICVYIFRLNMLMYKIFYQKTDYKNDGND